MYKRQVPIVAYNYGARNKQRIMHTIRLSITYAVGMMIIGIILFQLFPAGLLSMFDASEHMLAIGVPALRIISIHFIFAGFCIISSSVFQALGNGIQSMVISIVRQLDVYKRQDVVQLLEEVGYPGMRVMQFAFDPYGDSIHLPHHYVPHCMAYTGTHDNNTLLGWIWEATPPQREFAMKYCNFSDANWSDGGRDAPVCRAFMRTLWQSAADLAVVPIQDLLGYGSDTRINIPGVAEGNWCYRFTEENYADINADFIRELNQVYRR